MSGDPGRARAAEAALQTLAGALDEGIVVFDGDLRCVAVGRRVVEMFGVTEQEILGKTRTEVLTRLCAAADDPEAIIAAVGEGAAAAEGTVADPISLVRPRPRTVVWTSVSLFADGDGEARRGRVDIVRDVTRERRAESDLRRLRDEATVDLLTGLPNQRRFCQEAEREHRRSQRAWDSYAIARFDVDGMARVNEERGRAIGDQVIARLGHMIRAARREYDIVAYWQDDEFVVLLPGADARATSTVVKRVVEGVAAAPLALPTEVPVTVSAGAAVWSPPSGDTSEDVIRRAGEALAAARARKAESYEIDSGMGFRWRDGQDFEE